MAELVPRGVICGHSVPTILFHPQDDRLSMLWLGIANSFCVDFLARKKTAIAQRALLLTATGSEMSEFWDRAASSVGLSHVDSPCEDPVRRKTLRAELDVLVARDFFGLSKDEMRYLLDPADILGPDCGFETFGALKRSEARASGGAFTSRNLILQTWDRLPSPDARVDAAWAGVAADRIVAINRGAMPSSVPVARG
jgi:hypothetical protein